MYSLLSRFAASDDGPSIHVAPDAVFEIGNFTITNSILYGWVSALIIIAVLTWVARQVTVRPKGGIIQLVEAGVTFISNLVENSFDDKTKGRKYIPFFVTLFFFIMLNNWLGLMPGVGDALHVGDTPVLRAFTADLNGTLAAGIITMAVVYIASIRESGGFVAYVRHFFVGSPLNPLYLIIGILEIITDLTRTLSLALRLFLNVAIGEIVIAVFAYLGGFLAPLTAAPFTLMELFIGGLQAYIFTVLSLMYLAIAVNHASEHAAHDEEAHDLTRNRAPETIGVSAGRA